MHATYTSLLRYAFIVDQTMTLLHKYLQRLAAQVPHLHYTRTTILLTLSSIELKLEEKESQKACFSTQVWSISGCVVVFAAHGGPWLFFGPYVYIKSRRHDPIFQSSAMAMQQLRCRVIGPWGTVAFFFWSYMYIKSRRHDPILQSPARAMQ